MSDRYCALKLEKTGNDAIQSILQYLRVSNLSDACYAFKLRVKTEQKLIDKVRLKQITNNSYTIYDITDVVGMRLVALFKSEMYDLFEGLLRALQNANGINPNPFLKNSVKEVIIYKGNVDFDDMVLKLESLAKQECPDAIVKSVPSKEGYSSIHVVSRLERMGVSHIIDDKPDYYLPIETQIRTVFEDAWGEIDHKYGYVYRSGKETGLLIDDSDSVLRHLRVLKSFADACVEYSECIRQDARRHSNTYVSATKVVSVDADDDLISRFKALNVDAELIGGYLQARARKDEAVNHQKRLGRPGNEELLCAAKDFGKLFNKVQSGNSENAPQGNHLFAYYTRMNQAVCLMSTNDPLYVREACNLYDNLETCYPDFPLLKMRRGQAASKLGDVEVAVARLKESGQLAQEIAENQAKTKQDWPDKLPRTDYEHILRNQPKLLGYALWQKGNTLNEDDYVGKCRSFEEAYNVTSKCLAVMEEGKDNLFAIHNNLLYYAVGFSFYAERVHEDNPLKNKKISAEDHLEFVEKSVAAGTPLDLITMDTLYKAQALRGEENTARHLAEQLIDLCTDEQSLSPNSDVRLKLISGAINYLNSQRISTIL